MALIIAAIGNHATVTFAQEELCRCLRRMDASLFIDCRRYEKRVEGKNDILWIGLDGSVPGSESDDAIRIDVTNASGIITGSNERSVLIAAYRFLYELGCRFVRPGADGEILPVKPLQREAVNAHVEESASYRHRAVCIEGAVSYEHIVNMLDFLPKCGMNGYFIQFHVPTEFFRRWYHHVGNPFAEKEFVNDDDVAHIVERLKDDIQKRSLLYHAIGHGWTYESLGIAPDGNMPDGSPIPDSVKACFAQIDGKRDVWKNGHICDTNLCYSDPAVRSGITDCILDYCKRHTEVDYLHFWLADGTNNHCECENCKKRIPSDFYVMMLNELDRKLTDAGLNTKIVFLIYVDLLWAPETVKLENPDRFLLMFAPITRTYRKALSDYDPTKPATLKPYSRNRNEMPYSIAENVQRLRQWQEMGAKDSFDFDYHLMWDHYTDPGYYKCAKILHEDMTKLDKVALNGMLSCQIQRAAFPTGLPVYAMARGLWDKTSRFEDIAKEYFVAAFGERAQAVESYLSALSELLWGMEHITDETVDAAEKLVRDFANTYLCAYGETSADWKYLALHAQYCFLLLDELRAFVSGDKAQTLARADALRRWLFRNESRLHTVYDCWEGANMAESLARRMKD